jgi:hypothetical protein
MLFERTIFELVGAATNAALVAPEEAGVGPEGTREKEVTVGR